MDYHRIIAEIESRGRFASRPGVENSQAMFAKLQLAPGCPTIHIAGTNGKGSTAAYTAALLADRGLRVGLFTSPHLISYTERIRVVEQDGSACISEEDFAALARALLAEDFGLAPTIFDYLLVMAVQYYNRRNCDVMVLETGLGGRLDGTRGVPAVPRVSCITSIGLDHTAILGESIEAIAAEKAGILRTGTVCVIGRMEDAARAVIRDRCENLGVKCIEPAPMEVLGTYQDQNIACAAAVCRVFGLQQESSVREPGQDSDHGFDMDRIRRVAAQTVIPGRLTVLSEDPFVLLDVAHNGQGVEALADSLRRMFGTETFVCAVSMLKERDPEAVFAPVLPLAEKVYAFRAEGERAADPAVMKAYFTAKGVEAEICDAPSRIMEIARQAADAGRRTVVFGSFYFAGEVGKLYAGTV